MRELSLSRGTQEVWMRKQDLAYACIRDWIVGGELEQGETLDETRLAEQLKVSRIPLRDALSRLAAEGLIIDRPHQKRVVAPMSRSNAEDVYAGRMALETMLAEVATERASSRDVERVAEALATQRKCVQESDFAAARKFDRVFHFSMYEAAQMPQSLAALHQLRVLSERYIHLYIMDMERAQSSLEEHQRIFDAYARGDSREAAALTREHIEQGIAVLRTLFPLDLDDTATLAQ